MKSLKTIVAIALLALAAVIPATAQVTAPQGTFYAVHPSVNSTPVTLTAQAAGTVTSSDQAGFGVASVVCVFTTTAQTGTPSTTYAIQNKDIATGQYYSLVTSAAITAINTPTVLAAGRGVATTTNVGAGVPLSTLWRVTTTVGGTTPVVTAKISCTRMN